MALMLLVTARCSRRRGHGPSAPGRLRDVRAPAGDIASRVLAGGEHVVGVPPRLSARARVFATGQGRKTDATDAHSVALVATRMSGLRKVADDQHPAVLRILAGRRRSLGEDHTRMISQPHRLLLELIPGGAKKDLSAAQARVLLAKVRPRDAAGKARKRVAAELLSDLERIYQRKKAAGKEQRELLAATGSTLTQLMGIGPSGAARLLVEAGDITRFPDKAHFASWNGTAPDRRLLRRARPAPAVPRWQPADQPRAAHHGRRPAAQPGRGQGLPRPQDRGGQDLDGSHANAETAAVRHRLPPDGRRRHSSGDRPGRALGEDSAIQRDRPDPAAVSSDKPPPGPAADRRRPRSPATS
jgi:transposase